MRDLVLIGIIVLCCLVSLRRPIVGMLTFVCLGFLNPHTYLWTIGRGLPLSAIVSFCTIVGYLFSKEPKRIIMVQREFILLVALWTLFVITTFSALQPEWATAKLLSVSKILIMVFMCIFIVNNKERLHWLLRVISLSLGFYALKGGFFSVITGGNYRVYGPNETFLAANNALGLALAMNIPILYYFSKTENNKWLRRSMQAMLVFSYPAIVCTFSRGAWIGLGLVTFLLFIKSKYKFRIVATAFVVGVILLPYLPRFMPQKVVDRYDDLVHYDQEKSAQSRLLHWECCKRVGMNNPLFGLGFDYYSKQVYEKYFPEFLDVYPNQVFSCHGIWHTMFSEHGVPGLFLWIALIGSCFLSLRRLRDYAGTDAEMAWITSYTNMLQTALLAYMAVGTFYDAAYFDMFYYLVAIIIILKEITLHSGSPLKSGMTGNPQTDIRGAQ